MPQSSPLQRAGAYLREAFGFGASSAVAPTASAANIAISATVASAVPADRDGPRIGMFLEPSARSYMLWTPALVRAAEIAAEGGSLQLAADLCETMMADDRIGGCLESRTDGLLGRDLSFDVGNGRKKRRAVKALDAEADWWAMCPETEVKKLHAWGIMLGVGVAEMRWVEDPDHDGRMIPKLDVKHPRWLRFDWTTREWMLTVYTEERGQHEIEITPGDGKWLLYTPGGNNRPWAAGAYRALSRWCLLKRCAIQDWGFYSERHGMGVLVVTGTDGSKQMRQEIVSDLRALGRNAGMALPKGFEMKMIEAVANTWKTYLAQIEAADLGATITILGANLSTNISAGDGSKAAASEHGKVALGRTRADAETLSTFFHDQLLVWWALYNFGAKGLAPWPIWDCTPTEDLKDRAATLQMVGQFIGAVGQNEAVAAVLDAEGLLAQFGIPTRDTPAPAVADALPTEPTPPESIES